MAYLLTYYYLASYLSTLGNIFMEKQKQKKPKKTLILIVQQ